MIDLRMKCIVNFTTAQIAMNIMKFPKRLIIVLIVV